MRKPNTTCHQCDNPVYIRPNQLQSQKVWFCSRVCNNLYRGEARVGVCSVCSEKFRRKNERQKFCSRACSNKGRTGIKYDGLNSKNKVSQRQRRKLYLIERDGPNCSICGLEPVWLNKPLNHQVDHIDGNNLNNDWSNLRILCPNCHTQTETYGAKNIGWENK
jgi:5-methylcytosine-specific restriction endonuclease McrA